MFISLVHSHLFNLAFAEEKLKAVQDRTRFELDEVVVSATRIEDTIKHTPRNVTVITREDIEQAPGNNVVDLLAREANVHLNSYYGNDKNAGIDIRGQGVNATSNVLVLVDGFRLNPPDLSGPDLSAVPLDQIERIEIVRGASSVAYGDGAVGGAINIITKKGAGTPEMEVFSSYGSYQTADVRTSLRGRSKKLSYNVNAEHYDTDGYRENGFYRRKDFKTRLSYDVFETSSLFLSAAYHRDEYGLPGDVALTDIRSRDLRRQTTSPQDSGETTNLRFSGGGETDFDKWGVIDFKGTMRSRKNDYVLGFTHLKSREEQESHIDEDTVSLNLNYALDYGWWGRSHKLQAGTDFYHTDYISELQEKKERKNSLVKNMGVFVSNQWSLKDNLTFNFGFRHNRYEGEYRDDDLKPFVDPKTFKSVQRWVNGTPYKRNWDNSAFDSGVVYSLKRNITLFASYASSFRVPNVDELALAADELSPQKGKHVDAGVRGTFLDISELSLTFFQMEIEDEIFFDNNLQINKNYENITQRQGVELTFKIYPKETLYIWGNYTYMEAKFKSTNAFVPLVPKNSGSIGAEWQITEPITLALTGSYVGSEFDGNDQTNDRYRKIDAYFVVDSKITYTYKRLKVFAGVNNVTDELYETLAFSQDYYPMPERNFFTGIQWSYQF